MAITPQVKTLLEICSNFIVWHKYKIIYNPRCQTHIQVLIEDFEQFTGVCIEEETMLYLLALENVQRQGYNVVGVKCEFKLQKVKENG